MQETKKKSPTLDLRGEIGNFVKGEFLGRFKGKFGKFPKTSTLIKVEETNGSTTLWDAEKEERVEVDIEPGDTVFIEESTWLSNIFKDKEKGDKVYVVYTGKGKAAKGRKAPYQYEEKE